ncbi:hypothetical protein K443DRAFT_673958 [Laccaria amethystina LaAM-08-1]|uniref:Uncharacterized protein n=1 Tax=Laccaria amethystina LaAM-08-1 TaxID=1095629 RepID=A0A0C9X3E5_9AGAR|nr:hypothetical protein K443DRAFT_673958 [Laccaria amethystina LaAM-08-1]
MSTHGTRARGFYGGSRIFGRERDGDAEPPCQRSVASYHPILKSCQWLAAEIHPVISHSQLLGSEFLLLDPTIPVCRVRIS